MSTTLSQTSVRAALDRKIEGLAKVRADFAALDISDRSAGWGDHNAVVANYEESIRVLRALLEAGIEPYGQEHFPFGCPHAMGGIRRCWAVSPQHAAIKFGCAVAKVRRVKYCDMTSGAPY
jgi:hypothetical protein